MEDNKKEQIEEFKKREEQKKKKKKRIKHILLFLLTIVIIFGIYESTIIVKKINVSKLGTELCEYNGEHPIETGIKRETYSQCRGCSKIMKFDITITNELCDTCAEELHRCKRCGKLLEE